MKGFVRIKMKQCVKNSTLSIKTSLFHPSYERLAYREVFMRKQIWILLFFILVSSCEGIIGQHIPRGIVEVQTKAEFLEHDENQKYDAIIEQYGSLIIVILLDGNISNENIEIERLEFDMDGLYRVNYDGHAEFQKAPEKTLNGITISGKNKTSYVSGNTSKADGSLVVYQDGEKALVITYQGLYTHD